MLIRKGMRIFYKSEWQDEGDEARTFIAAADEVEGDSTIPVAQPSPSFTPSLTPWAHVGLHMIDKERMIKLITPAQMADSIKAQITTLIAEGVIPTTVTTYSQLHDYVDANVLGDMEELFGAFVTESATDKEHDAKLQQVGDIIPQHC